MKTAIAMALTLACLPMGARAGTDFWRAFQSKGAGQEGNRIAVLPFEGAITSSDYMDTWLRRYEDKVRGVRAVVLELDSPGGGVAASQEIYEAIRRFQKTGRKVVVAMSSVAASGAYYISCPADEIVADPGTLTGSIGVIMEMPNAEKLLTKVGLRMEVIKSGKFKDTGNFDRTMTPQERAYLQGVIDDVYGQFVQAVAQGRRGPLIKAMRARGLARGKADPSLAQVEAYVRSFADGRIFSGSQALKMGLVDRLGDLHDAVEAAARLCGIQGQPELIIGRHKPSLAEMLTGISRTDIRSWVQGLKPEASMSLFYRAW